MKLCFIADARASHARNWIQYFLEHGHEVHVISTYACGEFTPPPASLNVVTVDFSANARTSVGGPGSKSIHGSPAIARLREGLLWRMLVRLRGKTAPWIVRLKRKTVRKLVDRIRPDLVHAIRIPFEGVLAAEALRDHPVPLAVSIWGNDFTIFGQESPRTMALVRKTLSRTDGLTADCERDVRLAKELGLPAGSPARVFPGNGGILRPIFKAGPPDPDLAASMGIPPGSPVVINPRGVLPYTRTDVFFQAIPLVLARRPDTVFLGLRMEGNVVAEGWKARLNLGASVRLLPFVPHQEMARIYRLCTIMVSPADFDGVPNSMLEAIACGVFPVASDIDSVREWIDDGVNGLIFDQDRPEALASAILRGLDDRTFRETAAEINRRKIDERADYDWNMSRVALFYQDVVRNKRATPSGPPVPA